MESERLVRAVASRLRGHPNAKETQRNADQPHTALKPSRLTTWHASTEDQRLALNAQAARISAVVRVAKPGVVVPSDQFHEEPLRWEVECIPTLYELDVSQARCTPSVRPKNSSVMPVGCSRWMRDGFINATESRLLIGAMDRAMRGLFHQGAQTSIAPEAGGVRKQLGEDGYRIFWDVIRRVRTTIEYDHAAGPLYIAGSLMTRIWADERVPRDGMDVDPKHAYWNPHVDKANRASYDFSALLYLNSHCKSSPSDRSVDGCNYGNHEQPDFAGGEFVWLDEERDVAVEPLAGRLIHFTGGLENLHQPRRVTAGTRYVIGMWFTCRADMEYQEFEPPIERN